MTPQSAKKAKYKSLESLPYGGCPKGRFFYLRGAAAPLKTALPSADHFAPQARPNLFMRPKAALFSPSKRGAFGPTISFYAAKGRAFSFPRGSAPSPPFSFVPHCAGRSGGPFNLIDSGRPTQGLPASNAALAARPRWAVAASPPKREQAAGAVQEKSARDTEDHRPTGSKNGPLDPQSRHFCGNAVRHRTAGRARFDGGTMFPRKPLLFGRGILAG